MEEENSTSKILNYIGQIIAVIMIVRYTLVIVNSYAPFIVSGSTFAVVLDYIGLYAPMALMVTVGLSAVWTKSKLIKLAFLIICAAIVIFSFDFGLKAPILGFFGL